MVDMNKGKIVTLDEMEQIMRRQAAEFEQRHGHSWADCAVPDCPYKASKRLNSDKCDAHTAGRMPQPIEEYFGVE